MTKHDQQLLAEAYQSIEEGLLDRLRTRKDQAVGALKGAGKRIKGTAKELAGDVLSKTAELGGQALGVDASKGGLAKKGAEWAKGGKEETAAGRRSGQEAKYRSYINNSAKTIANDLKKLGMDLEVPEEEFIQDLIDTITDSLQNVEDVEIEGTREGIRAQYETRYKDDEGIGAEVAAFG